MGKSNNRKGKKSQRNYDFTIHLFLIYLQNETKQNKSCPKSNRQVKATMDKRTKQTKDMSLSQKVANFIFTKIMGWKVYNKLGTVPSKCIFCIAPHTSNMDFWIGKIGYMALGGAKPNFMIKKEWFRFPFNLFFGPIGGIPVNRDGKHSMTEAIIEEAKKLDRFQLAITPEGTRSLNNNWKRGFYYIAKGANIPLLIIAMDYGKKELYIDHQVEMTDDADADIKAIKEWYVKNNIQGKYPEKFGV